MPRNTAQGSAGATPRVPRAHSAPRAGCACGLADAPLIVSSPWPDSRPVVSSVCISVGDAVATTPAGPASAHFASTGKWRKVRAAPLPRPPPWTRASGSALQGLAAHGTAQHAGGALAGCAARQARRSGVAHAQSEVKAASQLLTQRIVQPCVAAPPSPPCHAGPGLRRARGSPRVFLLRVVSLGQPSCFRLACFLARAAAAPASRMLPAGRGPAQAGN